MTSEMQRHGCAKKSKGMVENGPEAHSNGIESQRRAKARMRVDSISKGVEQIRAEEQRQSKVFLNERRFYSE